MKKSLLVLFLPLLLVGCRGAQQSPEAQDSHYEYVDDYGNRMMVPRNPQRIVSTSPGVTEIVFALGAQDRLVGRTDFCTYPPEVSEIESIGGISNLNIEKILSLQPDLVISGSMIPKESVNMLNSLGAPMPCVIEKNHFDSLYSNIEKIGLLVGCPERADSLNRILRQRVQRVRAELADTLAEEERPKVYYVVGFGKSGNFTAGGNTFINDIIRMAGGRNIAEAVNGWSISMEAVFDADPDYIIIRKEDEAAFMKMPPYNTLRAVREHRMIPIESGLLDLQTPRNIEAVELLYKSLHP